MEDVFIFSKRCGGLKGDYFMEGMVLTILRVMHSSNDPFLRDSPLN